MDIDELVLKIRVSTENIKTSVDYAVAELKRIDSIKNELKNDIKFKIDTGNIKDALANLKALKDTGKIALEEEMQGYSHVLETYELNEKQKLEIDKKIYNLRKTLAKKEIEEINSLATPRAKTTDFAQQINEFSTLCEKYKEDIEILDMLEEKIATASLERNKKIVNSDIESLNILLDNKDREIDISKRKEGTLEGNEIYKHSLEKEIEANNEKISLLTEFTERYKEKGSERTDYESYILENLLDMERDFYKEKENIEIEIKKTTGKDKIKAFEEEKTAALGKIKEYYDEAKTLHEQALNEEVEIYKNTQNAKRKEIEDLHKEELKNISKQREDIIAQYASRISEVQRAVDAEIAQHQRRIDEINALLKKENIEDKDEKDLKKISVLEDNLKYEKDEGNKYAIQKELEKAKEAFEKRKREEYLEEEKQLLYQKISDLKDSSKEQIEILNQEKDTALKIFEEETEHRKKELELQKEAAFKVLDDETNEALKHYEERKKDLSIFYKNKYDMAVKSANEEKNLIGKTQREIYEYLMSEEVAGNYQRAGDSNGKAFMTAFQVYIDEIAEKLAALAESAAESGASSGGMARSLKQVSLNSDMARGSSKNSYDNRTAVVNQTFNMENAALSPYTMKKEVKKSLKSVMGG